MSKLTLALSLLVAAALAGPVAAGSSPTLHNADASSYSYDLECGASTTHSSIDGNTTVTLTDGCTLKVAGASKDLRGGMACEISGGSLSCR